jgi:hypothetical protein
MKPADELLQKLYPMLASDTYFCYLRSWWEGAGIDAVIWRRSGEQCFLRIIKTGETATECSPVLDEESQIDIEEFDQVRDIFFKSELWIIPQQKERIIYSNYDSWFGLKDSSDELEYWLQIKGGKPTDPRAIDLLSMTLDRVPELLHY